MTDPAPVDAPPIEVTGLLVCRELQQTKTGVNLRDVVEIVPVLQFPGEAGPLTFVAFVRPSRGGEADVSFRVYPMAEPDRTLVTLPGHLRVVHGYEGRQTLVAAGFKTLRLSGGGWFGVEFRLGSTVLARTRFAVGAIGDRAAPSAAKGVAS